jgi:hypothetical protein
MSPDEFYTCEYFDDTDNKQIEQARRTEQKNEHKTGIEDHQLDDAPLPGSKQTFFDLLLLCLHDCERPGGAGIIFLVGTLPSEPPALGGKFLESDFPDPITVKLRNDPLVLAVDPVEFVAAHINDPGHIDETANRVNDLPLPDFLH